MQRLFFSFPDGWPGIGLLWLRLVIGAALAVQGETYLTGFLEAGLGVWAIVSMALVGALCLIGGLFTPAAGVMAIVGMSTAHVEAQGGVFATLSGTVHDASGAVVPSATAVLVNPGTGIQERATTDSSGRYTFPHIAPGTYTLRVTNPAGDTSNTVSLLVNP